MKRGKLGFTLIEVAIFLAITGALFAGVMVGVQNSIYQQKTNDSVQSFVEFLRTAYAGVTDVQNTAGGRSEKAIYGKLITFGESRDLAGERVDGNNEIFVYTVIGDTGDSNGKGTFEALKALNASITRVVTNEEGENVIELAGIAESYLPKWAAEIEPPCDNEGLASCEFRPVKGMMLILRHPNSGTVTTFWSDELVEVNDLLRRIKLGDNVAVDVFEKIFNVQQIDFCINTTGEGNVYNRMDVRVLKGSKNASGIELIGNGTDGYRCGS